MEDVIHDTRTHGPLPGGAWEDLGDGRYRRLRPEEQEKQRPAAAAEDGKGGSRRAKH